MKQELIVKEKRGVLTLANVGKFGLVPVLAASAAGANAAVTMPAIETADIVSYIGLLVAAVATVGAAFIMVYLAAKGIKAIRAAF